MITLKKLFPRINSLVLAAIFIQLPSFISTISAKNTSNPFVCVITSDCSGPTLAVVLNSIKKAKELISNITSTHTTKVVKRNLTRLENNAPQSKDLLEHLRKVRSQVADLLMEAEGESKKKVLDHLKGLDGLIGGYNSPC